jgi:hypothetical protein
VPFSGLNESFIQTKVAAAAATAATAVQVGDPITLTATVGSGTATGTCTFSDGMTVLGTAAINGNTATFSLSTTAAGAETYSVTCVILETSISASSGTVTVATPQLTLTPSKTQIAARETVTIDARAFISVGGTSNPLVGRQVTFTVTGALSTTLTRTTNEMDGTVQFDLVSGATGGTIKVASQIVTGAVTTAGGTADITVLGPVPVVTLEALPSVLPVSCVCDLVHHISASGRPWVSGRQGL